MFRNWNWNWNLQNQNWYWNRPYGIDPMPCDHNISWSEVGSGDHLWYPHVSGWCDHHLQTRSAQMTCSCGHSSPPHVTITYHDQRSAQVTISDIHSSPACVTIISNQGQLRWPAQVTSWSDHFSGRSEATGRLRWPCLISIRLRLVWPSSPNMVSSDDQLRWPAWVPISPV